MNGSYTSFVMGVENCLRTIGIKMFLTTHATPIPQETIAQGPEEGQPGESKGRIVVKPPRVGLVSDKRQTEGSLVGSMRDLGKLDGSKSCTCVSRGLALLVSCHRVIYRAHKS